MSSFSALRLLLLLLCAPKSWSFMSPMKSAVRMDPLSVKFDGEKWVAEREEETLAAGYPAINTLLLHGPKPFLTRVFSPADYEQAVLKFMAGDKVDRANAQGNMDAYLQNPSDWQFNRLEEERRGFKRDYVTLKTKQVVLVTVWSAVVSAVVGRGVYSIVNNEGFYDFLKPFI